MIRSWCGAWAFGREQGQVRLLTEQQGGSRSQNPSRVGWEWKGPGEKPCLPEKQGSCLGKRDESGGWDTPSKGAWRGPPGPDVAMGGVWSPQLLLGVTLQPSRPSACCTSRPGAPSEDWGPRPSTEKAEERFPSLFLLTWNG